MGDAKRLEVIRNLLMKYIDAQEYEDAINFIKGQITASNDRTLTCQLNEHLAHCYSAEWDGKDDEQAFFSIIQCFKLRGDRYKCEYAESDYILGAGLYRREKFDAALCSLNEALRKSEEGPLKENIQALITCVEKEKKDDDSAKAQEQVEKQIKADNFADELVAEVDIQKEKAEAKRRRKKERKKKQREEKVEKAMEENAAEPTSDSEVQKDGETHKLSGVPEWQPHEFSVEYKVILDTKHGMTSHMGFLECGGAKLPKSFVEATHHQISNCHVLVSLCRQNESLLSVEHLVSTATDDVSTYLVTEAVTPVDEFFASELEKLQKPKDELLTMEMWWHHISKTYWTIFRDIARGLIFLYEKTDYVAGDLSFNTFVTIGGRGRILPTLDRSKKAESDALELVKLMTGAAYIPFGGKIDSQFLPMNLRELLDLIPHRLNASTPFLVDHPFFWTVGEKVDFTLKFKNLVKYDLEMRVELGSAMAKSGAFVKWSDRLVGVYRKIYEKAETKKSKIASYKAGVDIARYFGAVYSHINDYEYKPYRKDQKKLNDGEIERDLASLYPEYYVTMFECLCCCSQSGELEELKVKGLFRERINN